MGITCDERGHARDTSVSRASPRPVVPPIYLSAGFDERDELSQAAASYTYSRYGNPTVDRLERALAEVDDAEAGAAFASGMGAIHAVFAALLGNGAPIAVSDHVYPGTEALVRRLDEGGWLTARFFDPDDPVAAQSALHRARLLWLEVPSNPGLHTPNMAALTAAARTAGALVAVDATMATPVHWRPLQHGVDLAVHSLTKYVSGGGDVLGGIVVGSSSLVSEIKAVGAGMMGNVLSAFSAFLLARGLESLTVRVRAQSVAAAAVCGWLSERLGADRVWYPRHPCIKRHDSDQPFGAVVLFRLDNPDEFERRLRESTVFRRASSFGDAHSIISCLRPTQFPPSSREALQRRCGSLRGLFRLAVGLDDLVTLERELDHLLSASIEVERGDRPRQSLE